MLEHYCKQFEDILTVKSKRRKDLLLANLMTQMEHCYELSMIKERFERETDAAVKELYLAISNARKF